MFHPTDDLRIERVRPLIPPAILMENLPLTEAASTTVAESREAITRCLRGDDDRLLVVVGPCSIHDVGAALEYAQRLRPLAEKLSDALFVVMRVYFEKPRTTVGLEGPDQRPAPRRHVQGQRRAASWRASCCWRWPRMGLPAGCEFLDTITPQYIADLVSWGAIGARTTESQVHRELASGLSVPVGFKNGTDGNIQIAIDAVQAASHPHQFLSRDQAGAVGDRGDARQPRLPHHPARRQQGAELRGRAPGPGASPRWSGRGWRRA